MNYLSTLQDYLYRLYQRGYSLDQAAECFRELSRKHREDKALVEALATDLDARQQRVGEPS